MKEVRMHAMNLVLHKSHIRREDKVGAEKGELRNSTGETPFGLKQLRGIQREAIRSPPLQVK